MSTIPKDQSNAELSNEPEDLSSYDSGPETKLKDSVCDLQISSTAIT